VVGGEEFKQKCRLYEETAMRMQQRHHRLVPVSRRPVHDNRILHVPTAHRCRSVLSYRLDIRPSVVVSVISGSFSSRSRTTASCPFSAVQTSAVDPSVSVLLTLAPSPATAVSPHPAPYTPPSAAPSFRPYLSP
jgi:hypothetical protein